MNILKDIGIVVALISLISVMILVFCIVVSTMFSLIKYPPVAYQQVYLPVTVEKNNE